MKALQILVLPPLFLVGFVFFVASEAFGCVADGLQQLIERIESL